MHERTSRPTQPAEETALRKIAASSDDPIDPAHLRRLLHLGLVQKVGQSWRLTPLGSRRHEQLTPEPAAATGAAAG